MATYKVGADGKAQSGLKAGDEVVTAGGTYKITGVNADGTYQSTLTNKNQTTNNYTGSYANGSSGGNKTATSSTAANKTYSTGDAYTSDGTTKRPVAGQGADVSRHPELAGQSVYRDGYVHHYDEDGDLKYAEKSESPNYAGHTDPTKANQGYTTDKHMWTDEQILTAADLQKIADLRAQGAAGTISWAEANAQANAIRSGYGYTIGQDGTVVDQQAKDRAEAAQQATGATQYYDKATGTYQPIGSAPQTSVAGQQQTVTPTPGAGATGSAITGQQSGGGSAGAGAGGVGDYSEYLKDLYAANMEAELAALEEAYKANVGTLETAGERIGETYHAARNQAAAQNEVERRAAQEYFAARGLNTGAAGQMELSRSTALQGQLGALSAQEAQAVTDNQRAQDELARQYELAVARAKAENNASRAQALYEELIRQENAALAAQMAAQEQANWEKQFAAQQQQYRDKLAQTQRAEDYEMAMAMLGAGIMPDSATLASAGISQTQASALQMLYQAQSKTASTSGGGKGGGSSGSGTGYAASGAGEYAMYMDAMNSGMDPRTYVKSYYKDYGLEAMPNESAYKDWEKALPDPLGGSGFETFLNKLNISLSEAPLASVDQMTMEYWPVLTETQRARVQNLYAHYGKTFSYA